MIRKTTLIPLLAISLFLFAQTTSALTFQEIYDYQTKGLVLGASTNGLVGYWNFDEGRGATAADSSGNGNNGTINGATWTTGKVGSGALSFNGASSYVQIPYFSSLNPPQFTLSAWVYFTGGSGYRAVLSSRNSNYNQGYIIYVHNSNVWELWMGNGIGWDIVDASGVAVSPNTWTHIVASYDGSAAKIYINGVQKGSSIKTYVPQTSKPALVGAGGNEGNPPYQFQFPGKIDEVRIYSRALSSQEITDIYNDVGGAPSTPTAPTISSFSAFPSSITSGQSTNLSWSVSGNPAPTLLIDNGIGVVSGSTQSVSPTQTTVYTLIATNSEGSANDQTTITVTAPSTPDTTAPSVPTNLSGTAVSPSAINLSWVASTDNVGVTGYKIYRGGSQLTTTSNTSYSDTGLSPLTPYSYTVSAYDAAGNSSPQSSPASATTQAAPPPPSGNYPWSNILSPGRAIDWSTAGLPSAFTDKGGTNAETTTNPWTAPVRTKYGSTINPSGSASTDLSNINTALSNCPDGSYVLLGSGTFQIQGTVIMYQHSCTLRGSGPQSTTLALTGAGILFMGASGGGGSCGLTLSSNYAAGSKTIICNGLSGAAPAVGNIALLKQCDTGYSGTPCAGTSVDNGSIFVCGWNSTCASTLSSGINQSQYQTVRITSVVNNGGTYTIGIDSGLYMSNWAYAQTPVFNWNSPTYNAVGVGLEDLTIYGASSTVNTITSMQYAYASWIKGVRYVGPGLGGPLSIHRSKNVLIANNYFFSGYPLNANYPGPMGMDTMADSLVLNNITASGFTWEGGGQNVNLVFAYNYGRDQGTSYVENQIFDHHPFSSFDLFEGNETGVYDEDYTFGTHALNTYFRNLATCWDGPYSTYSNGALARGMVIDPYHRFENFIGNAIGDGGYCTGYQGTGSGSVWRIRALDSTLVSSTLMRWGNVSVIKQLTDTPANSGVRFAASEVPSNLPSPNIPLSNPVPSNSNLPSSFFMGTTAHPNGGTGLSWWKVCTNWVSFPDNCAASATTPFPFAGPDVSGGSYVNGYAYNNPAAIAWQNLPIDTTYQNSYNITGSSWSNGIETLTFNSGTLPNVQHLMGGFQLTGASSACLPTSGVSYTGRIDGEVLITGSKATTISYALASNPGSCSGGTFKFPDVRMFDETVYEADLSGSVPDTTPPAPPTGVSVN
jgi:hypothetical protein